MRLLTLFVACAGCLSAPERPDNVKRTWQLQLDGGGAPGELEAARMAYDPENHQVVLYGGYRYATQGARDSVPLPIMWQRGATTWSPMCIWNVPVGRYLPAFAYDPNTHRYVLAGGALALSADLDHFASLSTEVWTCDGTMWSYTGQLPQGRAGAQMVFDADRRALVLAGGVDDKGVPVPSTLTSADGGVTWNELTDTPFEAGGKGTSIIYDDVNHEVLALQEESAPPRTNSKLFDTLWALPSTAVGWRKVCDRCSGIPRRADALVHIGNTLETYLLNGFPGGLSGELPGTWILDHDEWLKTAEDMPKRDSVAVAWDPDHEQVISYGGNGVSCSGTNGGCSETWMMSN